MMATSKGSSTASSEDVKTKAADEKEPDKPHADVSHHHHNGHVGHHAHGGHMPFYRPPRQRQRWGDEQIAPHTDWGDIFFDLFYVAAAYNLGNLLREDPSARGLLYLTGCFFPIMSLWVLKMFFTSRFYVVDDIFHRLFEVASLVPLATAVLHIRTVPIMSDPENYVDIFAYSLSIAIGLFLNMSRSAEVMICYSFWKTDGLYPESYYAARRDVIWGLPPILFTLAATIYSGVKHYGTDGKHSHRFLEGEDKGYDGGPENDVAVWLCLSGPISYLATIAIWVLVFSPSMDVKKYTVPMNIDYSIHRWGEWVMLLLGESVLSLLIVELSEGFDYYLTFFCGVITVILLQYLHFRSQPHDPDNHAMRRSRTAGIVFTISMWVYSAALIILGTVYKMFLYEFVYEDDAEDAEHRSLFPLPRRYLAGETSALRYDTEDRQQRIAHFFSGSLAVVWFCLDLTILSHQGFKESVERLKTNDGAKLAAYIVLSLRFGLVIFIATLSQYLTDPSKLAYVGMLGVFVQLCLRAALSFAFPTDDEEQEEEAFERMATHLNARLRSRVFSNKNH